MVPKASNQIGYLRQMENSPVSGFNIRIDGVWRGIYRAVQLGKFVTFTTLPVAS